MLIGDYWFDFEKMEAYRYLDYLNMNLATSKIRNFLVLENGSIKRWNGTTAMSEFFFKDKRLQTVLNKDYNMWITEQIEKIVL